MAPKVNLHSFRVAKLEIFAAQTRASLGDATGFFCEFRGHIFLVTNWHVVSGRHFQTKKALHASSALPGTLMVHAHIAKDDDHLVPPTTSTGFNIPLYDDDDRHCWLEHPVFGSAVDVIAINVASLIADTKKIFRINLENEMAQETTLAVMDQAFVTGYPLSATTTPNSLPIYKSGTIASEPYIFDSEPRIYIDGKTKNGMSGSPVMVKNLASSRPSREGVDRLNFIGIYSGRDRQERTEFEAELGIVWPYRECLVPILEAHLAGAGST